MVEMVKVFGMEYKQGKRSQEYEEVKDESRRGKRSKQTVNGGKEGSKETK